MNCLESAHQLNSSAVIWEIENRFANEARDHPLTIAVIGYECGARNISLEL